MIRIKGVRLREVIRPLRTTFATSLGQKERLHSVIVTVALDGGASGTGEVPTSLAFSGETVAVIRKVLHDAAGAIRGSSIDGYFEAVGRAAHRQSLRIHDHIGTRGCPFPGPSRIQRGA